MNLVPDASVVVKWFVPERDHAPARDLRDDYLDGRQELIAPALCRSRSRTGSSTPGSETRSG